MTDIAIIGAGISGLVCAQQLRQAGYSVVVVEKSRGVGGRVATRRLQGTCADHGACYIQPQGELLSRFVKMLCDRHIIELWTDTVDQFHVDSGLRTQKPGLYYVAPAGMSAIAKFLTPDLEILLDQRAIALNTTPENTWRITLESSQAELTAKAVVVAIPSPQAWDLLAPLEKSILDVGFLDRLSSVQFDPSISVMMGYPANSQPLPNWKALTFVDHADLGWIGFDSSKRLQSEQPHFVLQSSAKLAQAHLETPDLQPVGQYMLEKAAESLALPWLKNPEWMQIHRWRYAFPRLPLNVTCLSANTSPPLVCCGDWCGGNLIAGAMLSGLAAAGEIDHQLDHLLLENVNFLDLLEDV